MSWKWVWLTSSSTSNTPWGSLKGEITNDVRHDKTTTKMDMDWSISQCTWRNTTSLMSKHPSYFMLSPYSSLVTHPAGAYPFFPHMSISTPLKKGCQSNTRFPPRNWSGFPDNSSALIYTTGQREAKWKVSVLPKNTDPASSRYHISYFMNAKKPHNSSITNVHLQSVLPDN